MHAPQEIHRENDVDICTAIRRTTEGIPIATGTQNNRPKLDTSELLELPSIKIFQSMIGACQWIIQLGRFDIAVHIMSMGSFRAAPRVGHLEHMKRIYGYLMRFKTGTIRIRTGVPDFFDLKYNQHDWSRSPYAGAKELIPDNIPEPKGGSLLGYTPTLMQTYITTRPTVELSRRYYTFHQQDSVRLVRKDTEDCEHSNLWGQINSGEDSCRANENT